MNTYSTKGYARIQIGKYDKSSEIFMNFPIWNIFYHQHEDRIIFGNKAHLKTGQMSDKKNRIFTK